MWFLIALLVLVLIFVHALIIVLILHGAKETKNSTPEHLQPKPGALQALPLSSIVTVTEGASGSGGVPAMKPDLPTAKPQLDRITPQQKAL